MGHMSGFARSFALAFGAACIAAMFGTAAIAASKPKPAAAAAELDEAAEKQKAVAGARAAYDGGIKSFQAGKLEPAVQQLSTALRGGGLASTEMARALYVRGMAYKRQSKPGLAISDLTSALWLKNGLNDTDRQSATTERAEAYRLAGLGDGNSGAERVSVIDPNAGAKTASSGSIPAPIPAPIPSSAATAAAATTQIPEGGITRQAPDSEAAQDAARARKLAMIPADDAGGVQTLPTGLAAAKPQTAAAAPSAPAIVAATVAVPAVIPAPIPSALAPATPAPVLGAAPVETTSPAAALPADPPSTVAGFFSNLFGGGSSAPASSVPPGQSSVTTSSTTPATAATSSWSDTTSIASTSGKPAVAAKPITTAAITPAAVAKPVPTAKTGKYKVHIAAVRSRAEAEALAQKVQQQHGTALNSRAAQVDEAVIGSMGTFYRVRVTGYANADEPRGVCNALRTGGFDCLVVTN